MSFDEKLERKIAGLKSKADELGRKQTECTVEIQNLVITKRQIGKAIAGVKDVISTFSEMPVNVKAEAMELLKESLLELFSPSPTPPDAEEDEPEEVKVTREEDRPSLASAPPPEVTIDKPKPQTQVQRTKEKFQRLLGFRDRTEKQLSCAFVRKVLQNYSDHFMQAVNLERQGSDFWIAAEAWLDDYESKEPERLRIQEERRKAQEERRKARSESAQRGMMPKQEDQKAS